MIHVSYVLVLAVLSFINMYYYCWLPFHAIYFSAVSGSSSPTCLLIVVPAMYESVISLAMFTWVPSYFLCPFGSWSARDFCYMQLVDSLHAFVFHVKFCSMLFDSSKHCNLMLFLVSLKLLYFAILPCPFEHVLVISGDSSVFMFCHALPVLHDHEFCSYVGAM